MSDERPGDPDEPTRRRGLIVTGGGSGIGEAVAERAAAEGWIVGVLDRDATAARRVAARLGAVELVGDIRDESAVEALLDRFADHAGHATPDALVCSAGIVRFGPLLDLDRDDWDDVIEVNLTGTFVPARAVARRMVDSALPGAIVTVTSMNGVAPGPNAGAYGSTKAAVGLLTQQMALEWGRHGIRVNAVAPGLVDGGLAADVYRDDEIRRRRSGAVPLGRLGTVEDIAGVVMFLLSDRADYITGTQVLVDGGVTMSVISSLPRPASLDGVGIGTDSEVGESTDSGERQR